MSLSLGFLIFVAFSSIDMNVCIANPILTERLTPSSKNAFPFIVSIHRKEVTGIVWKSTKFRHYCGGSLITKKLILTSAHCFYGKVTFEWTTYPKMMNEIPSPYDFKVILGSNDMQRGQEYKIKSWLTYEKWAGNNNKSIKYTNNDIAIVELLELVDAEIKLAKITSATDDELRDQQVLTAGWGMINDGSIPRYMMEVQLNMVSRQKCLQNIRAARKLPFTIVLDKNTVCTNGGSDYALLYCGDSGSPLFWKGNEIIGINQSICPAKTKVMITGKEQNIHIDIRIYKDFISSVIDDCDEPELTKYFHCLPL